MSGLMHLFSFFYQIYIRLTFLSYKCLFYFADNDTSKFWSSCEAGKVLFACYLSKKVSFLLASIMMKSVKRTLGIDIKELELGMELNLGTPFVFTLKT